MANLPYGRPGSPSWNYAMRQQASGSFDQNKTSAVSAYEQSEQQLNQARNLTGSMGAAITDLNFYRATAIYPQVNTFLGYAQSSADAGYEYTNLMKPQADTPGRQADVTSLEQTYFKLTSGINDLRNTSTTLMSQASEGEFTSRTVQSTQALSDDSAGAIVQEQQAVNAENADVQNPPADAVIINNENQVVPRSSASNDSNAERTELSDNADLGPNGTGGASQDVGGARVPVPASAIQNGVSAAPDDWINQFKTSVGPTTSIGGGGRPVIPPGFTAPIVATPNKLASLSSQTYSISIYMLSEAENQAIINGQKISFPPNSLIIQSGGINSSTVANQRNRYFDVDFYIDDIELESLVGTQGTGAAHNVTKMKFRISEVNGITLLNRLDRAVREYSKLGNVPSTAINQNYVMIIRFYGYDQEGKMVTGEQLGLNSSFFGSDKNAISEKWIPFTIGDLQYQISSKGVEYDVTAVVTQSNTMFSSTFGGTIPFNFELVAPDLKTLFNGPVAYSTDQQTQANTTTTPTGAAPAAAAASAAPVTGAAATTNTTTSAPQKATAAGATQTVTQGLAAALNQHQQDLVKKGQQEIADQYEIQLYNLPGLIDATLIKQGTQDKTNAPMQKSTNASQRLLMSKNSYDKNTKNYNITAGTQVVQLIDLAVRNSSFITNQQTIVYDQNTQQAKKQQPVATTMWFRIQGTAQRIGYDRKRRNSAYKFKYVITPYQINEPRSPYFNNARYRGVHKIYNYWFTGQNSEVLDFVIDVNYNYAQVVGVDVAVDASFSGRWAEKRAFQTRPGESSQGAKGTSTMPAASLADRLYSAEDVMKCELTILGDPDWLIQSEVFYTTPSFDSFMPDGSVNAAASEVLYEVRFNAPTDFNLGTGLTPVFQNNTAFSAATGETNLPSESIVYSANVVKSYFKGGKFTQKLSGTIKNFDKGVGTGGGAIINNAYTALSSQTRVGSQTLGQGGASIENAQTFDTSAYNAIANTIDDAGGAEMTTQEQQQVLDYAAYNAVADTIDDAGGIGGTVNQTGTGTILAESNNPIQEDTNNNEVSPSLPSTTDFGMAPDDDAGYDP